VNRGVDPRADFIEQISGRTLNACLIAIVATALALVLLALYENDVAMSAVNLFLFLAGVLAYNIHAAGSTGAARWILIVAVMLVWNFNIVLMGTRVGLEYCLGGVLLLPLLLFEKEQKKQMYAASALIVMSLPLAIAAETRLSGSWPFNATSIPPFYYLGNAVILAFLVFLALYFYNRSADESFRQLEDQEQKSAELIHSMLPAYIAEKLAKQGTKVADWHSEASVLFATVTGFESLYKRVSAVQLVELLRQIFEEFDELVEAEGVEKINTLGTNYVAATGIDASRSESSDSLARVAVGMRRVVERVSEAVDHPFGLRIGITTGDVVSGVIGDERPCFDIWGRTVELANAMRDDAADNTIVVNEAAYWRLKQAFHFEKHTDSDGTFLLVAEA
jgi:class 3 adenylate cyclase